MAKLFEQCRMLSIGQQNPSMTQGNDGCPIGKIIGLQKTAGFAQCNDAKNQKNKQRDTHLGDDRRLSRSSGYLKRFRR